MYMQCYPKLAGGACTRTHTLIQRDERWEGQETVTKLIPKVKELLLVTTTFCAYENKSKLTE